MFPAQLRTSASPNASRSTMFLPHISPKRRAPLWMPPGLILVRNLTACGSPRPEICLSSHPLHFLWNPIIFGEQLFPTFCICTFSYVPWQPSTQLLRAALTMKEIPVLHGARLRRDCRHKLEGREKLRCVQQRESKPMAAAEIRHSSMGQKWFAKKLLGVILGISWSSILAQRKGSSKEAPANTT